MEGGEGVIMQAIHRHTSIMVSSLGAMFFSTSSFNLLNIMGFNNCFNFSTCPSVFKFPNSMRKASWQGNWAGSRKFSKLNNSSTLFCSGVPVRRILCSCKLTKRYLALGFQFWYWSRYRRVVWLWKSLKDAMLCCVMCQHVDWLRHPGWPIKTLKYTMTQYAKHVLLRHLENAFKFLYTSHQ